MTSELKLIREFGEHLKPATGQPPRELRHRVLTGVAANRSTPIGMKRHSRSTAGFASAAATVVAMAALVVPTVAGDATRPATVSDDVRAVQASTATDVLRLAGQSIAGTSGLSVGPGQFSYTETVGLNQNVQGSTWQALGERTLIRQWRSADGSQALILVRPLDAADAAWQQGQAQSYDTALPTDGDAMYRYLYRPAGDDLPGQHAADTGADERAWERAVAVLTPGQYSPAVRMAALVAMSRIPHLTVRTPAVDVAGRSGVAVVHAGPGGQPEVIFDASTYQYLGTNRTIELAGLPGTSKSITVDVRTAVQHAAVVDRIGDVP